jgi:hypothetical protein
MGTWNHRQRKPLAGLMVLANGMAWGDQATSQGCGLVASLWQTFFAMSVGAHIPAIAELPPSACGCNKNALDALGYHVSTCTAHSGAKKAHDWAVAHIADLFRTTHRVKTQQVARSRGQRCGDIELSAYLENTLRGRCNWCWTYVPLTSVGK